MNTTAGFQLFIMVQCIALQRVARGRPTRGVFFCENSRSADPRNQIYIPVHVLTISISTGTTVTSIISTIPSWIVEFKEVPAAGSGS